MLVSPASVYQMLVGKAVRNARVDCVDEFTVPCPHFPLCERALSKSFWTEKHSILGKSFARARIIFWQARPLTASARNRLPRASAATSAVVAVGSGRRPIRAYAPGRLRASWRNAET